jgi:hypothetical protein
MSLINKKLIIILNGWAGCQRFWRPLLDRLNVNYKVKLIDTCSYLNSNNIDQVTAQIAKLISIC